MQLTSPAFADQNLIPDTYTCKVGGVQPPLAITGAPDGTQSFAIIMHDPDAPDRDFLHWAVWNLPPDTAAINENELPSGAVQGLNDFHQTNYGAPCPPSNTHRYVFELYALDDVLTLPAGSRREQIEQALAGHVLDHATLTGLVTG